MKLFGKKGLELVSLPHFLINFFKKDISLVIFYLLTKTHFMVAFDDDDIDDDDDDDDDDELFLWYGRPVRGV